MEFLGLVFPFFVFLVTGTLFVSVIPAMERRVRSTLDRLLLGLLTGMGFYMLAATVLNALLRIKLTPLSLGLFFLVTCGAMGYRVWKRRINPFGERGWGQLVVLAALLLIFGLAISNRTKDTLKYPTRLMDADPYRHHDRTRMLVETGHISPWDSHIYGKVPVLEMQGCYVLPAVISLLSGVSAWHLWKYGSLVMGAMSVLATYLLAKYSFRGKSAVGVVAAAFIAATPIHILRTNMGFSEAYAVPFLPVALLSYLFLTEDLKYGHSFFFGVFYTAVAMANPIPAVFLLPVLVVYGLVMFVEKRRRLRLVIGIALSAAIFFGIVAIWTATYLGVSAKTGLKAANKQGTEGIAKSGEGPGAMKLFKDNLRVVVPALALLGIAAMFVDRRKEVGEGAVSFSYARVFHLLLFFIYLAYAALVRRTFDLPWVGEFKLPSFTSKIYRYYLLPGWSVSMLAGWAVIAGCDGLSRLAMGGRGASNLYLRVSLYVVATGLVVGTYTARPWVWGHWGMNCTEEEYAAADWIEARTSEDAIIMVHWYTGDYIRSLTGRRIALIDSLRPELRAVDEIEQMDVPRLSSRKPQVLIKFSAEHSEELYVVTSQWGPWRDFSQDDGFTKVFDMELDFDEYNYSKRNWGALEKRVRIYRVEKDGKTKAAKAEGNLAFGAKAIGGCEGGTVRNLERLNDGSLGRNRDEDAVFTDPRWEKSGSAWFGLDFGEEREVASIKVAFGMYALPSLEGKSDLQYVPIDLRFQYWRGNGWVDIPIDEKLRAGLRGSRYSKVRLAFPPVKTRKVRVAIERVRNQRGEAAGGYFRAAVLEFAAYTPLE